VKSFLKKILPRALFPFVKTLMSKTGLFFVILVGNYRFTANMYYLFDQSFVNEQKAVLLGRRAYYNAIERIGETCALLRRNTHRLEKGLIMRPRREVFAEGFIQETIDCYENAIRSPRLSAGEKKWATDVLDEYFSVVGSTQVTSKAKAQYKNAKCDSADDHDGAAILPSPNAAYKPYAYKQLPQIDIKFEDLNQLFIRRRSVRWYEDKPVPLTLVQRAANIASLAPSACNRQSYRFVFCNNKDKAVAIANCAGGTTGFAENLPAIIAVVGDLSSYPAERDRHLIYIDGSLGAMQLMLSLETLRLSSCPINWPEVDANERKIRKIIDLQNYERVVMLLAVGYADREGGIPYSQKKTNNLILEDIS
jgi:nitroreductase